LELVEELVVGLVEELVEEIQLVVGLVEELVEVQELQLLHKDLVEEIQLVEELVEELVVEIQLVVGLVEELVEVLELQLLHKGLVEELVVEIQLVEELVEELVVLHIEDLLCIQQSISFYKQSLKRLFLFHRFVLLFPYCNHSYCHLVVEVHFCNLLDKLLMH
jgi:hypothetical protein